MVDSLTFIKNMLQLSFQSLGYQIVRSTPNSKLIFPIEASDEDRDLLRYIVEKDISMVPLAGLWSTLSAVKYVCENKIPGDFVECGVWRGGNAIIAAEIFRRYNLNRRVFLFDTFAGMTSPTTNDLGLLDNQPAIKQYKKADKGTHNDWCYASIDEVRNNFRAKNLLDANIIFIQGDVENTLQNKENLPAEVSVLRLDTDWYESTRVELEVLFPRLALGGCLIIDDYGFWSGSKKAVDEYFSAQKSKPLLQVTDYTRRISIKI